MTISNRQFKIESNVAALEEMASVKELSLSAAAQAFMRGGDVVSGANINAPVNPYRKVLWFHKCVNALARTMSGIPLKQSYRDDGLKFDTRNFRANFSRSKKTGSSLRVAKGSSSFCVGKAADGQLVESGAAYDLFARPNGYHDSLFKLIYAMVGYLFTRGKVAWILNDMVGNRPGTIHVVDGRNIEPKWARDKNGLPELLGYMYRPPKSGKKIPLACDEVKYWALWDDGEDPLGGMAPSLPGKLALATDYNASLFNASALANGCDLGTVFSFKGGLTPDQKEDFADALRRRHNGAGKARRPIVMEGDGQVSNTGTSLRDMEHNLTKQTTRLEICALLDVPPVVAGWVDAAGDSSAYTENSLKQFYSQAIFPLGDVIMPAIQEIVSRFDQRIVAWWNLEDQPVVQQMRLARIESAQKLFAMGYPPNRIDDVLDLGMGEVDWGEEGFLPIGLAPAREVAAGGMTADMDYDEGIDEGEELSAISSQLSGTTNDEATGNGQQATGTTNDKNKKHHRGAEKTEETTTKNSDTSAALWSKTAESIWKQWMTSWQPLARAMRNSLRTRYHMQQRKALTALKREERKAKSEERNGERPTPYASRSTVVKDESVIGRVLLEVFGSRRDKAWQVRCKAFITDANSLGIRQALVEAGVAGDHLENMLKHVMNMPSITRAISSESLKISSLIDDRTRAIMRNNLRSGMEAGEGIRQLSDRVQSVMGNRRRAAIVVARNSVGQALSSSRHTGAKAAGMTHKTWLHSRGPGERRPEHIQAEREYSGKPIRIDELFFVGGERLMYPRDFRRGSPKNTVNCQCLQISTKASSSREAGVRQAELISRLIAEGFEQLQ